MRCLARCGVGGIALDADEVPAEPLRHGAGGAGAEERVEHDVARLATPPGSRAPAAPPAFASDAALPPSPSFRRSSPVQSGNSQSERICMSSLPRLQRLVVEGVASCGVARRPDQRLMRVGEAAAAEIRHRVGLAPDDVVEDPEAEVLQRRADAEDVVIGADDPERRVRLQHAAAGGEPGAGEVVIGRKARELVPVVVDRVDLATGRGA